MTVELLVWNIFVWGLAGLLAGLFLRGARTLRRRAFALATPARIGMFVLGVALLAASFAWPLLPLSQHSLLARMAQKVVICLIAAPLLWLSFPFHVLHSGLPAALRRPLAGLAVRHRAWTPLVRGATGPLVAWFLYMAAFLVWHDPGFVDWEMQSVERQTISMLVLLCTALLFWQQVTLGGPRRYATAQPGASFAMLVGAEVPNVVAGITIAFGMTSIYAHYDHAASGEVITQQSLSGALTWVFGSLVYIGAMVGVVNRVFQREGAEQPLPLQNWDAGERLIAPGLEARLREQDYRPHDWDKH